MTKVLSTAVQWLKGNGKMPSRFQGKMTPNLEFYLIIHEVTEYNENIFI